jgi:hypothetical protein
VGAKELQDHTERARISIAIEAVDEEDEDLNKRLGGTR